MKTNIHFLSYLAQLFLEWEMFQTKCCRENQYKSFMLKYCKIIVETDRPTSDNMAQTHCMLET